MMLQVYVEDRLVGHLNSSIREGQRAIDLHFIRAPLKMFYDEYEKIEEPVVDHVSFAIKTRAVAIPIDRWASDSDQARMLKHSRQRFHIPDNAKAWQDKDVMTGDHIARFKWNAIECPQDTYDDHLFDHHLFEPI